ncbi:MAG: hypothetical protein OXG37_13065 [Actinomycetia bacterium]|nr:hypothetical protein [Actinomycetes bacterium]
MWVRGDVGLFRFLVGGFGAPVAGRVRLDAGVVQHQLECAHVGLDGGRGEFLLDQGFNQAAAVPSVEREGGRGL